jgi:hypothetical protein
MSLRNQDRNSEQLQFYEHPELDVAFNRVVRGGAGNPGGLINVRLSLPEIRVRSRIAVIFEPDDPNERPDIRSFGNTVVGFACIKTRNMVTPVGEIWGKNGIPLQWPKSNILGIKLETQEDCPWIDIVLDLHAVPCNGRYSVYYHATSDNKLKFEEWDIYSKQVTAEIQGNPLQLQYVRPPE